MPNALLIYPEHPPTYWGMKSALEIIGKKSAFPPLGLLTIATMFPPEYNLRLVDLNVTTLKDEDLEWADIAFTSTMIVQRVSLQIVIEQCKRAGVPVVAGGPHPTTFHEEIDDVDHLVLDEVEETFPQFLQDLAKGSAKAMYREPRKPDITQTPIPRFDLIDMNNYHTIGLQFSRGCPFDCEFCDITKLYGRVARTKTPAQMVEEFELIYRLGWRGQVFLVDDNFIGNKRDAMKLLPVLAEWQKAHGYPFSLCTEASVNLARLDALMEAMVEAGFDTVFLGIETPNPEALIKTKKPQNLSKRDDNYLFNAVRKIQNTGMQVQGGFILGLDGDDESVFDAQISFIQETGIPVAAIYLLTALKGTDMYHRLEEENRLLDVSVGTSSMTLNFQPEIDPSVLIDGYQRVTTTLYDPTLESYFERCLTLIENLKPVPHLLKPKTQMAVYADIMGLRRLLSEEQLPAYLRFIAEVSKRYPRMLPKAIDLAAQGYHFEKFTRQQVAIHDFKRALEEELA
ncbi:MAG: DUF4070 domain-containing protein, partial [Gammaproteobacteria bacterium]|nr:DUF4070 domain-containing protein [Gammaproteobacteria bacterium]